MAPDELARVERRWQRERRARLEAERIAEHGLRRMWEANAELDARVAARTAELDAALDAARAANRATRTFLANLGHEVRTPLHRVLGNLELARAELRGEPRVRVDAAHDAATALDELLGGLLLLVALEASEVVPNPRPITATALVAPVVSRWRPRLAAMGSLLVEDVPVGATAAHVDPDLVATVLHHLLDNAARHAPPGTVTLAVAIEPQSARIAVRDEGEGIPLARTEDAFRPFVQLDDGPTRRVGGAGIGLAIVRGLAAACGGTVAARRDDRGFVVEVALPQPASPFDGDHRAAARAGGGRP